MTKPMTDADARQSLLELFDLIDWHLDAAGRADVSRTDRHTALMHAKAGVAGLRTAYLEATADPHRG